MAEKNIAHMYTVSRLTGKIKRLLEENFPFIWVTGEISNYAVPASGHSYFTLKDSQAIIQSVMFKNQKRNLKFSLENGMNIFGLARITLYEPRGSYQLVFEHIEPAGTGSIQVAYEQLKSKLQLKGFFDPDHKKPIPLLPSKVCIITSITGAAVQDILNILHRRFANLHIDIIPVTVQGDDAVKEICCAMQVAQAVSQPDIIILARGGGSLEDLQAFNSEPVAEAVHECDIPVITGIGHETDVTIADFVADLRAPTPSAAAELAVPDKTDLVARLNVLNGALHSRIIRKIELCRDVLADYEGRLKTPALIIYNLRIRLEDFQSRLTQSFDRQKTFKQQAHELALNALLSHHPHRMIADKRNKLDTEFNQLNQHFRAKLYRFHSRLLQAVSRLDTLSPLKTLSRGYSITRKLPGKKIIKNAADVRPSEMIEIILSNGRLTTEVKQTHG